MTDEYNPLVMAKGILWEEAKGKLRAMAAVDGSRYRDDGRYEVVSEAVEAFINKFEDEGLHE